MLIIYSVHIVLRLYKDFYFGEYKLGNFSISLPTNDDIKYFKSKEFKLNLENCRTPITGHIDILQVRNGLIHILDYKPEADKINATEQLTIYALALASRTKLALKDFKCAWFDENNYYEFFPLHAVYEKK